MPSAFFGASMVKVSIFASSMKLHLPQRLRNALIACFAGFAGITSTCATGTVTLGACSIVLAGAYAQAELSGPDGVTYTSVTPAAGALQLSPEVDTFYTLTGGPDSVSSSNPAYSVSISAKNGEKHNIKFAIGSNGGPNVRTIDLGTIQSETLWLAGNRFKVTASTNLSEAGTIYVGNGQLWIASALTLDDSVNFVIGASTFSEGITSLDNAALRVHANTTINGTVNVAEDAAIAFQGASLTLNKLTGNGNLTLKGYSRGTFNLGANTLSEYSGTITAQNNVTVRMNATNFSGKNMVLENGAILEFGENTQQAEYIFNSLSLTGGALVRKGNGAESQKFTVTTLANSGNNTMSVTSWNGIYNIRTLTGDGTLELLHNGVHWSVTSYILGDATAFSGNLHLNVTNTDASRGAYQSYLELGSSASGASVTLSGNANRWASLALNAEEISLKGLSGNSTSYVYCGSAPTEVGNSGTSIGATLPASTGTTLLTLGSADNYDFFGTLASGINLVKNGNGTQYIASLAEDSNRTIKVNAGVLSIGSLGGAKSLEVAAGAEVNIPMSVSGEKQWGPEGDKKVYYEWTSGAGDVSISGDGVVHCSIIEGKGETVGNDAVCNYFNATGYSGTDLTVTSGKLALFNPENPAQAADFGSVSKITLEGGALFAASSYFGAIDRVECSADLVIGTTGGWLVDYGQGMTLSGSISGTGTLHKTKDGVNTILTGSLDDFQGSLAIEGGGLTLEQGVTVSTLTMASGTSLTAKGGINVTSTANMNLNGVTVDFGAGSRLAAGNLYLRGNTTLSGVMSTNAIRQSSSDTITFSGAKTHVSSTRYVGGDAGSVHSVLTVTDGATYDITGDSWGSDQNAAAFLLGHWGIGGATGVVNIENGGTLNVLKSGISVKDGSGTVNIKENSILNIKALGCNIAGRATVNLDGGTINVGEFGIANNSTTSPVNSFDLTLNLNGGTLGILSSATSWYCGKELTVGESGISINTNLYDAVNAAYTDGAGTITLNAAVSGGMLTKTGVGTLQATSLSKVTVAEGYLQAVGQGLTISDSLTLGEKGSILFENGGKLTTAQNYNSALKLTLAGLTAGEYSVFQGASSLTAQQVKTELLLDRGFEANVTVNNGLVKVQITGSASSEHKDLVWNTSGVSDEWVSGTVQNWTAGGAADRFSTGDNVTFSGTGERVLVNSAVTAGSMNVSGSGYIFSGSGSITVQNGLTITGDTTIATAGPNSFSSISVTGAVLSLDASQHDNLSSILGGTAITWGEGGTLRIFGGALNLGSTLAASGTFDLVIDDGAVVTRTSAMGSSRSTTVKKGGTFILSGGNAQSALKGSLTVEGTLRTQGDVFGYNNASDFFTGITISGGTWEMGENNNTLSNSPITLDHGVIEMNVPGDGGASGENGLDFFSDNATGNLVKTLSGASGQSIIRVAEGAVSGLDTYANKIALRRNVTTFDIARATALSGGTTSDLKVDVAIIMATDADAPGSIQLIKKGDGILELSAGLLDNTKRGDHSSVNTELSAGTLRFSENAVMGSGTITMAEGSTLELAQASANENARVAGSGLISVTGTGHTTLASWDNWTGKVSLTSTGSFGVAGGMEISSGRELAIGNTGGGINSALTLSGGTLAVDFAGTGAATSLQGGVLTLSEKTSLKLTNFGEVTADTVLTLLSGVGSVANSVLTAGETVSCFRNTLAIALVWIRTLLIRLFWCWIGAEILQSALLLWRIQNGRGMVQRHSGTIILRVGRLILVSPMVRMFTSLELVQDRLLRWVRA